VSVRTSGYVAATEHTALATHYSEVQYIPKYEFRFQAWGGMDDVIDLLLAIKNFADEKQSILFSDLRSGGLRPIGHGKLYFYIGLRKVRIKLTYEGCSPVPGSGIGDDSTIRPDVERNIQVNRLSSRLWEISTRSDELYLNGYLIKNAPLTPLTMYESDEALIEATLRVYPKEIELQNLSESPGSRDACSIKNKLLKIVTGKIIGKDGDEIVLMRYSLRRQRIGNEKD
jgi:hypothetical protein